MRVGHHLSLWSMWCAERARKLVAKVRGSSFPPGARVALLQGDKVVLVRHWYAPFVWTLPGGGIVGGETPEEAARREVFEEVGVIISYLRLIDTYQMGKGCEVTIFLSYFDGPLQGIKNIEIMQARLFPTDALPKNVHPLTEQVITKLQRAVRNTECGDLRN